MAVFPQFHELFLYLQWHAFLNFPVLMISKDQGPSQTRHQTISLLLECALHKGNISSWPCSTKEHQKVSLDLKPRNLLIEVRILAALPCIFAFRSLRCLKTSSRYASFEHHFMSAINSANPEFPWLRNVLTSSLSSQSRAKTEWQCIITSSDILLPFPQSHFNIFCHLIFYFWYVNLINYLVYEPMIPTRKKKKPFQHLSFTSI